MRLCAGLCLVVCRLVFLVFGLCFVVFRLCLVSRMGPPTVFKRCPDPPEKSKHCGQVRELNLVVIATQIACVVVCSLCALVALSLA